jgi:site-specific DNA recombinase
MTRAVLYARVSRDDRSNDGRNLAGQLEMGQEYAQEHGYTVIAELAEDDRGASGAEIDLPQLNRVRDMARRDEFDVLVVREIDCLSRNLAKQLIVEQELKRDGVEVKYVLYDFPNTPEGRLNKHVRAMLAEYEREKITERLTRGRRRKVKDGHVMVHGRPPYGYRLTEVDGKRTLVVHEPEAQIVYLIFQWYTTGDGENGPLSMRAITSRLTEMKVPTWYDIHGKGRKKRGYGEWSRRAISRILSNETYAGVWYYGQRNDCAHKKTPREHWIAVAVPEIVDRKTWEAVQKRKAVNKAIAKRNTKQEYLVGRRVRCGLCGSNMYGRATIVGGKLYKYYYCIGYVAKCDMPSFHVDQVDVAVWGWVKSFLTDPAALAEGLRAEQEKREQDNAPLRQRVAVIDDLLADNRRQLERLLDLYLAGDFPKEMLTERKGRLEKTIGALEREWVGLAAQLEAQTFTDAQIQSVTEFAEKVRGGLGIAERDFEKRRRLIELLDVWVTLTVEDGEKVVYARCMLGDDTLPIVSTSTGTVS